METTWESWVREVLAEERDDAFVRLLRNRLEAGERVLRVNLVPGEHDQRPSYLLVLLRGHELSQMQAPHSASFTRWSLETGTRLETVEEEAARFALLLDEALLLVRQEVGEGYLRSVLVERLLLLAPPRTAALLRGRREQTAEGHTKLRVFNRVDAALRELVEALGRGLGYPALEAAEILDRALERTVDGLYHLAERRELFGR